MALLPLPPAAPIEPRDNPGVPVRKRTARKSGGTTRNDGRRRRRRRGGGAREEDRYREARGYDGVVKFTEEIRDT